MRRGVLRGYLLLLALSAASEDLELNGLMVGLPPAGMNSEQVQA